MNIRLTLLLATLTICSIHAETIRERLQKEKTIADERIINAIEEAKYKAKKIQGIADFFNIKSRLTIYLSLNTTGWEQYIIKHSVRRASVLEEIMICMNHSQCIH